MQAQVTATVHGHVQNAAGQPVTKGDVKFSTDKPSTTPADRKYQFTFPLDANGNYKGDKVSAGDYFVVVVVDGKNIDFQQLTIKPAEDRTIDFDMTRAEFIKAMSPADRAAVEEYKKKNAAVSADNAKIANINKTLLQAREDEKNGKADVAVTSLQGLVAIKPDESVLWASLGEAQLAVGDSALKAARAANPNAKPDDAMKKTFSDAAVSYQKAIDLNSTSKKPSPENLAVYYLNLGQAQGKAGNLTEAGAAYEMAAKTSPAMAAGAYYNESVVFYTANKLPEAEAAADKAIAADPKRADAFYIKAQSLVPGAKEDPATHKFVLPPGCLEAYQEYLALAPDGPHAAEVKELLTGLGQPVVNSFKATKH